MKDIEQLIERPRWGSGEFDSKALWKSMNRIRVPDEIQPNLGRVQQAGKMDYVQRFREALSFGAHESFAYGSLAISVDAAMIGDLAFDIPFGNPRLYYISTDDAWLTSFLEVQVSVQPIAKFELRTSGKSTPSVLRHVSLLADRGEIDTALDVLYDYIDDLLKRASFSELDALIQNSTPERMSTDVLLGILTATLPAKSKLPSRRRFFDRVAAVLGERNELEDGLLTGLDG